MAPAMICTWRSCRFEDGKPGYYWLAKQDVISEDDFAELLAPYDAGLGWYILSGFLHHAHPGYEFYPSIDLACVECGEKVPEAVILRGVFKCAGREHFPECEWCRQCGGTGTHVSLGHAGSCQGECIGCPVEQQDQCWECEGEGLVSLF